MSKWKNITIEELVKQKIIDKPLDGNHGDIHPKGDDFVKTGIPFIMASDIENGKIDLQNCKFITQDQANSLKKGFAKEGDVLLTHKATIGRTAIVPKIDFPYIILTPQVTYYRVRKSERLNNKFLKYYFDYKPFQDTLNLWAGSGSTRSYLGITGQLNLQIKIPDIITQKKIATVLSALDNKIELNNRINTELENLAKTIYDYWFVQFDFPDKNGKPYKASGGKMVYNQELKRSIPKGWEVKELGKIITLSNDSINPMLYPNKVFKYFSIPKFDETNSYYLEIGSNIKSNKFLVSGDDLIVSKLNPWFNRVIYPLQENDMICSTEFVVLKTKHRFDKNFLYLTSINKDFITYCSQLATGTSNSHKRIVPKMMMKYLILFNQQIINEFGKTIDPIIQMIISNRKQNQELTQLRDWLLPMLMNGQVTVK